MSFALRTLNDHVTMDAGGSVGVELTITNEGDQKDSFEVIVDGIDPEWFAIPVPMVTVEPGKSTTEKIFLKPPRASESTAGTYPFLVQVRSLETGEAKNQQISLEIKSFHHLSLDINPKKGLIKAGRKAYIFSATLMNLGNAEAPLEIYASDTDGVCQFDIDQEHVTVGPGQEKVLEIQATTSKRPLLANSRLHAFSVSARGTENAKLSANAHAQLEQRALISPGTFLALLMLIGVVAAWVYAWPKPPTVDALSISPQRIELGQSVTIDWVTSNANVVEISADGEVLRSAADAKGNQVFTPTTAKTYLISAIARDSRRSSEKIERRLVVDKPPPTPDPEVLIFRADKKKVPIGGTVMLTWAVNDATTKLILEPKGELDVALKSGQREFPITQEVNHFSLVAMNAKGVADRKSIDITGYKASKARIIAFEAVPKIVKSNTDPIKLSWQVVDAIRLEIVVDEATEQLPGLVGEKEIMISKTTRVQLIAYDDQGETTKSSVTLVLKPDTPPKAPDPDPDHHDPEKPQPSTGDPKPKTTP